MCLPERTPQEMIYACALASSVLHALIEYGEHHNRERKITEGMEPIDKAIFKSMKKYHIDARQISTLQSLDYSPFDPVTKYVLSVVKDPKTGAEVSACKGAVQSVLAMVEKENGHAVDLEHRRIYLQAIEEFASRGFRSLGVALRTEASNPWMLVGVLPLFDPPRDDSAQTIATAKTMGVKVKMLTGDQLAIAKETGHQLNMGTNMFDADKLQWTTASGAEIADCMNFFCFCCFFFSFFHSLFSSSSFNSSQTLRTPTDSLRSSLSTSTRSSRPSRAEAT